MELKDLILFPLYVLLFHIFFRWRRKRIEDPLLKKYHKQGFWIKVLGTLAFTIFYTKLSSGDSTDLYFAEGANIAKMVWDDFSNIKWLFMPGRDFDQTLLINPYNEGYFASESNFFVTRLVAILSFVSFNSYMVINLFFSMISFSGVWKLYRFFYEQYPHLHKKLAIAILYLPTFVFWSSGILKDPLCTGLLGWMTYSVYQLLYKKQQILKNIFIAFFSGYIIGIVKSYILVAYLPLFILFLVLSNFSLIKRASFRIAAFAGLILFSILGFFFISDKLQEELGNLALDKLAETVKNQQASFIDMADKAESSFSLGTDFDGTNRSLIKMAPAAVVATLFRPYLWESKKLSTLFSSLESLTLMIFTLYVFFRAGPLTFLVSIFKDPMVMFCFFFSVLFALFVGATTLNFGTLVRYKIPCLPFYVIAMVLILEISKRKKAGVKLEEASYKGNINESDLAEKV
ncbi:MAG: hypothetical protein ABIN67_02320 [Ferruginibacter sp.]